jgi:hypothetical protein
MKTWLIILTLLLAALATGTTLALAWQHRQNRELARANDRLQQELRQSQEAVSALTLERTGTVEQLAILTDREKELSKRVESLEATSQTVPRPYRVRTFLGQDHVGQAWMMPHNLTRDPESGRYTFEPVLVIDESARHHFTERHTNVVEREVYRTEIYEDRVAYPYYYVGAGHPGRPGHTPAPPKPSPAPTPTPQPAVQPQLDARARLFAPPMSTVNSRPQVIGTPATSPVNQRVFAP